MRKLALFLHIYQPPTQVPEITRRIAQSSYLKITKLLGSSASGKITLNVNASLTEQLDQLGYQSLLNDWRKLHEEGRIEFTASAAYHPLLTKIPRKEIFRQIELNNQINRELITPQYKPKGFFPPEMVYNRTVGEAISEKEYDWIILDESAHPLAHWRAKHPAAKDKHELGKYIYQLPDTSAKVFFRQRGPSLDLAYSEEYSISKLLTVAKQLNDSDDYLLLAMDGETFGEHHAGLLPFLRELFNSNEVEMVTLSELLNEYPVKEIEPLTSTWGVTVEEPNQEKTFPRWDNPDNPVHRLQWELFRLALEVGEHPSFSPDVFDRALHSDQFYWAAHNPCWHLGMVARGAQMLVETVEVSSKATSREKRAARRLRQDLIETGRQLYGEAVINC